MYVQQGLKCLALCSAVDYFAYFKLHVFEQEYLAAKYHLRFKRES